MSGNLLTERLTNTNLLWNLVFGMTMLVYAVGLFVPIMEPDAAVYAQVSMEMHDRSDYLSIYHKGDDWLDKPHFPFWMSALSYEIFGVNTFAYKLPAVLFILLAAFYTYKFCKKFYSAFHGRIAVIILITAEHIIISNQDVRAEPFMTGLMIMGLYHFASLVTQRTIVRPISDTGYNSKELESTAYTQQSAQSNKEAYASLAEAPRSTTYPLIHILLGSFATACLIMTKGLFTVIPLASGIGFALVYFKKWKEIFHLRWLAVLLLTTVFLAPAIYGYYLQFDKHPEKIVFGQTNVSGVEFFLWTSQWGRFTNTGPITGKGDVTFFIHTLLWAFLPWAFAAFYAIFQRTKKLFIGRTDGEYFTFFGFITLFLIFSASSFQLSFYLNPLFPLLAIFTAAELLSLSGKGLKTFSTIHFVLCCMLSSGLAGLHFIYASNLPHVDTLTMVLFGLFAGFFLFSRREKHLIKTVFATALVVVSVNYYLNREFYPSLLKYQAESEAAYYIKEHNIDASQVLFADEMQSVADVILKHPTKVVPVSNLDGNLVAGKYVFTSTEGTKKIDSMGIRYEVIKQFDDFPVTRLTGKFINKNTRQLEVKKKYLLKVEDINTDNPRIEVSRLFTY